MKKKIKSNNNEYDIIGQNIGIWHIDDIHETRDTDGHLLYDTTCLICGYKTYQRKNALKEKNVAKSCTHLTKNGSYHRYWKFVWENERIKNIFTSMINRCYNENDEDYCFYGARGIKICDEWISNPKLFEIWSLKNGYRDNLTIDRINSNKDYCPENCWWVSALTNAKYKSTTNYFEIDGEIHSGRDWSKIVNLGLNTINKYLRKYPEEAVKELIRRRLKDKNFKTIREPTETWFEAYGINVDNYREKI